MRRGFGTMVMEAMAEHSVDGTVHLDYAPSTFATSANIARDRAALSAIAQNDAGSRIELGFARPRRMRAVQLARR
jgi:hypothetical protein